MKQETDGFCAALPVILKQSGTKNVTAAANEVVRTLSNYPASISHGVVASKIMEKIITSRQPINKQELLKNVQNEVKNMFPDVESSLHSVFQHLETDHFSAVTHFGRQCYNPGSFQVRYLLVVISSTSIKNMIMFEIMINDKIIHFRGLFMLI